MACSGLKACEGNISKDILITDPTKRIINMGFAMLNVIQQIKYNNGTKITLKIGVNYGRVIAGVIGYHKPQFSLIGDTVNTASRMCSTGKNAKINISETAYQRLQENDFLFIKNMVDAKGLGQIPNYVVEKKFPINSKLADYKIRLKNAYEKYKLLNKNIEKPSIVNDKGNENIIKASQTMARFKQIDNSWSQIKNILKNRERITEAMDNLRNQMEDQDDDNYASRQKIVNEDLKFDEQDDFQLKPNKWLLTFSGDEQTKAKYFEEDLRTKNKNYFKITIGVLFGIYLLQTLILITIRANINNSVFILVFRSGFNLLLIILMLFSSLFSRNNALKIIASVFFFYGLMTALIEAYIVDVWQIQNLEILELMFIYLIGSHFSGINFFWTVILSICMLIAWLIIFGIKGILSLQNIFFFCSFLVINLVHSYIYLKHEIQFYNNLQKRERKKTELKGLVSQLLPLHCIEKYFNDPNAKLDVQDDFENVTILFADIKGFTEYSNSVTAQQVVKMLSELFTSFDKMCLKYSVYKVYTIGDCYVALGFIDQSKRDYGKEAVNMVKMALSMIEIIKEVRNRINFHKLDMRIGLHTGRIIGGIIGTDIVRYDIYGPDVLIANKMESNGVEGRINVSEDTKNLLEKARPDFYHFDPHVMVKSETLGIKKQSYLLSLKSE